MLSELEEYTHETMHAEDEYRGSTLIINAAAKDPKTL